MKTNYKIPIQTRIGHIHLKVSDIKRSLEFYCDLLGFEITTILGTAKIFLWRMKKVLAYFTPPFYTQHEKIWLQFMKEFVKPDIHFQAPQTMAFRKLCT